MRRIKQLIYGVGCIAVIVFIIWAVNAVFFAGPPTCFDGVQNQSETGIDCGGPCLSCSLKNVQEVQVKFAQAFRVQDGVGIVAEIYNPNIEVAAQNADYALAVKDGSGNTLRTLQGNTFLYAGELKYIVVPFVNIPLEQIGSASLTISNPQWVSSDQFQKPNVELQAIQTKKEDTITVEGRLANQSEFALMRPEISALLYNRSGELVAASRTVLDNLDKFSSENFVVVFSQNLNLYQPTFQVSSLFTRDLTIGDSGQDVGTLQVLLAELGLLVREPTNYYDELTAWAVAQMQEGFGLDATGIFDEASRAKITELLEQQATKFPAQDQSKTVDPSKTKVFIEVKK